MKKTPLNHFSGFSLSSRARAISNSFSGGHSSPVTFLYMASMVKMKIIQPENKPIAGTRKILSTNRPSNPKTAAIAGHKTIRQKLNIG